MPDKGIIELIGELFQREPLWSINPIPAELSYVMFGLGTVLLIVSLFIRKWSLAVRIAGVIVFLGGLYIYAGYVLLLLLIFGWLAKVTNYRGESSSDGGD